MEHLLPSAIIFAAAFTQSLSGFGVALVAMALLPGLVGMQVAAPLVALVAVVLESALLLRYREALNLRAVWPVALASIFGVPLGIWALKGADEELLLTALGLVISGYALYALLRLRTPQLRHPLWAYGAGLLAGILGGAYNTSGPPVILYAHCRRWPPAEFKSNLQGFFLFNSFFVVASHALSGNFTPLVWTHFTWAIPALVLGMLAGTSLDRYLDPATFRQAVLVLLVVMGLRLVF